MKISDETMMSFADDELDAAARAQVEAAMREDPNIEKRIEEHRALRSRLQQAYAQDLDEEPPQRLLAAARGASAVSGDSNVVSLDAARQAAARLPPATVSRRIWRGAASIAASMLVGVGVGAFVFHQSNAIFVQQSSGLVAGGVLAKALSDQLGGVIDPSGTVGIGASFVAKSGGYCRTFTVASAHPSDGLACREGGGWQIQAWVESTDSSARIGANQNFRPAGSSEAPAVLSAVEERIAGDPLDQVAEATALRRGWQAR